MFDKNKITTLEEVKEFFLYLYDVRKVAFHPDDSFDSYINVATKEPTFTPEECEKHEQLMKDCVAVCADENVDIYELALSLSTKNHNNSEQ